MPLLPFSFEYKIRGRSANAQVMLYTRGATALTLGETHTHTISYCVVMFVQNYFCLGFVYSVMVDRIWCMTWTYTNIDDLHTQIPIPALPLT